MEKKYQLYQSLKSEITDLNNQFKTLTKSFDDYYKNFNYTLKKLDQKSSFSKSIISRFGKYFNDYIIDNKVLRQKINLIKGLTKTIEKENPDFVKQESKEQFFSNIVTISKLLNNNEIPNNYKEIVKANLIKKATENDWVSDILTILTQSEKKDFDRNKIVKQEVSKKYFADIILKTQDNKILFLKRNKNSEFAPGCWGLPGGHIDLDEFPLQAAIRECEEETSLDLRDSNHFFNPVYKYSDEKCEIYYFKVELDKPLKELQIQLYEAEHDNYIWTDDYKSLVLIPGLSEKLDIILNK